MKPGEGLDRYRETTELVRPLELRAADADDGRTLEGRIVPYGEVIDVAGQREAFDPGAFSDVDPAAVVLLWQHDTTAPIGRMTGLEERDDGAYGTFRLAATPRAEEARSLMADGIIRGLSVGFATGQTRTEKGVRHHTRAVLMETSLVTFPAYKSAGVLSVREEEEKTMSEKPTPAPDPEPDPTPEPDPVEARLAAVDAGLREVRNQIGNLTLAPAPVDQPSYRDLLVKALQMVAKNPGENRALADVIGTGTGNAEGLVPPTYASEVLGVLEPVRPFFAMAGSYPFPDSGYTITFPRITQHTQVAKRTGEKTEIASRELTVAPGSYAMEWFAGGVDVALELIAQSDPDVLGVVVDDLLDQYALVTEDEFVTDVEAAATVGGGTLDTSGWAAFSADVIATSRAIKTATGRPGDRLALTTASWSALVGLLNPGAPASLPGSGPDLLSESVDVKGVLAFHSPESTVDVQFNTKALRNSEKPPLTATATNVALMGHDIGLLGATVFLPLYPAGIVKYAAA